mgnify:CR=1 FL=1
MSDGARQHSDHRRNTHFITGTSIIIATAFSLFALTLLAWTLGAVDQPSSSFGTPPAPVVIATVIILGAVLAGAVALEAAAVLPILRRPNPRSISIDSIHGRDEEPADRPAYLIAVIPAHNEESALPSTLEALQRQIRSPDQVIVIADNCIDQTIEVANRAGCTVFQTRENHGRKAGALNQGLDRLLPDLGSQDLILVMDADTRLSPHFIQDALRILDTDQAVSAVGGVFMGDSRSGVLAQLQRNEFARYARQIASRRGRVFVLTGTATVFRASVLKEVALSRGGILPGENGWVYAESSITEDNEITLAVKTLGAHIVSPHACRVTTETMPSLRTLWIQRLRWHRGALENLSDYGMQTSTARYWMQQWGLAYGSMALPMSLIGVLVIPILMGQLVIWPFWVLVTLAFSIERGLSAWQTGWKGRLLAFSLVPEIVYSLVLQACFLRALTAMMASQSTVWGHLPAGQAGGNG